MPLMTMMMTVTTFAVQKKIRSGPAQKRHSITGLCPGGNYGSSPRILRRVMMIIKRISLIIWSQKLVVFKDKAGFYDIPAHSQRVAKTPFDKNKHT